MERQIWEHSPQIHVTFDTVTIQKIKIEEWVTSLRCIYVC